jgi:glycerate-2-kinase
LSAALGIAGCRNTVIASVDTDGTDGPGTQFSAGPGSMPGCFAGGIVDGGTVAEAGKAGLNIDEGIKRHNTSPILWELDSGIVATPNISLVDFTVALVGGTG